MAFERRANRNRRCLIEKNPHLLRNLRRVSGWLIETAGGEFDHRLHLFPVQPIEPFHNVVDIGPGFQIFEDSGHRHPGTLQNPCPAHFARDAFDGGTRQPTESCHVLALLHLTSSHNRLRWNRAVAQPHEILRHTIRRDIERFYNAAAEPFETTLRKIEAGEEPFAPRRAPEDYDAPEYEYKGSEAYKCLGVLGNCSLGLTHKALHDT